MFMYTLSLMFGTAGLPHVIIRFFTVPRVRDARTSAGWALVFIAILYTTAPSVAAMARLNASLARSMRYLLRRPTAKIKTRLPKMASTGINHERRLNPLSGGLVRTS